MLDGYRLVYPDSPDIPPRLWEWEEFHIRALFKNGGFCTTPRTGALGE